MHKLTHKQRNFIYEYLIDINATQAAIRSGYSAHTARQIGQRLLTNVDIKREIDLEMLKIHADQKKRLLLASEKAINALIDILEYGSGTARVSAANSILDRAEGTFTNTAPIELSKAEKYEESTRRGDQLAQRMIEILALKVESEERPIPP